MQLLKRLRLRRPRQFHASGPPVSADGFITYSFEANTLQNETQSIATGTKQPDGSCVSEGTLVLPPGQNAIVQRVVALNPATCEQRLVTGTPTRDYQQKLDSKEGLKGSSNSVVGINGAYEYNWFAPTSWSLDDSNWENSYDPNYQTRVSSWVRFLNRYFCAGSWTYSDYDRNTVNGRKDGYLLGEWRAWSYGSTCAGWLTTEAELKRTKN